MRNPWRDCKIDKPPEYTRVQIKNTNGKKFIGYRYKNKYYETIGNYVIDSPYMWRYIPVGSYLWTEIVKQINKAYYTQGEVAYVDKL